jgi:hypothetical protein
LCVIYYCERFEGCYIMRSFLNRLLVCKLEGNDEWWAVLWKSISLLPLSITFWYTGSREVWLWIKEEMLWSSSHVGPDSRFNLRLCCVHALKQPISACLAWFKVFIALLWLESFPNECWNHLKHPKIITKRWKGLTMLRHGESKTQCPLNIRKHEICQYAVLNLYFHMENNFYPYTPFLMKKSI